MAVPANLRKLSQKHLRAIEMMSQGAFASQVAKELGVAQATVYGWRADPTFRQALDETCRAAREEGLSAIRNSTMAAVGYLVRAVSREEITTPGVKAATELLDRAGILQASDPSEGGIDVTDSTQVLALLRSLPPSLLLEALKPKP